MKTHSSKSIILGHKNFGELDKLIFLYNEELGKIKVIAKGARKITSKFTGHLESLSIAETSLYFGPKNIILTEIDPIKSYKNIRTDYQKLSCALQIAEISNQLIYENQKIEHLIELFEEALHQIDTSNKPQLTAIYYIIKLLDQTGFIPNFKENQSSIKKKYLKFLHYTQTQSLEAITKISLSNEEENDIKNILTRIIEYQTNFAPKSLISSMT